MANPADHIGPRPPIHDDVIPDIRHGCLVGNLALFWNVFEVHRLCSRGSPSIAKPASMLGAVLIVVVAASIAVSGALDLPALPTDVSWSLPTGATLTTVLVVVVALLIALLACFCRRPASCCATATCCVAQQACCCC